MSNIVRRCRLSSVTHQQQISLAVPYSALLYERKAKQPPCVRPHLWLCGLLCLLSSSRLLGLRLLLLVWLCFWPVRLSLMLFVLLLVMMLSPLSVMPRDVGLLRRVLRCQRDVASCSVGICEVCDAGALLRALVTVLQRRQAASALCCLIAQHACSADELRRPAAQAGSEQPDGRTAGGRSAASRSCLNTMSLSSSARRAMRALISTRCSRLSASCLHPSTELVKACCKASDTLVLCCLS